MSIVWIVSWWHYRPFNVFNKKYQNIILKIYVLLLTLISDLTFIYILWKGLHNG